MHECLYVVLPSRSMVHRKGGRPEAIKTGIVAMVKAAFLRRPSPRDLYRRMLVEFGLTPSSRSRLKTTAKPARDALAEFLARRNGHSASPLCDG